MNIPVSINLPCKFFKKIISFKFYDRFQRSLLLSGYFTFIFVALEMIGSHVRNSICASFMNIILLLEDVLWATNIKNEQGKQIEGGRPYLDSLGRCGYISLIWYIKGPRAFSKGFLQIWSFDNYYYDLIAKCRWLCWGPVLKSKESSNSSV